MSPSLEQTGRLFSLDTPLGADVLLVRKLSGTEEICGLFQYTLELVSEDWNIDFDQIVGKSVTIGVRHSDDESFHYLNGIVSKFSQVPPVGRLAAYRAEVVPWLWFLTRTTNCAIWQKQEALEVIKSVFEKFGFRDYEDQTTVKRSKWFYCTQYRETACDFVKRLMEIEGIFFFFRHEQGRHVLVMADTPAAHKPSPYQSRLKYEHSFGTGFNAPADSVLSWQYDNEIRPGKYTHQDYNFKTPSRNLQTDAPSKIKQGGNDKFEIYDYPGSYELKPDGEEWARMRMEEEEMSHAVITATSNCRALYAGSRFELYGHDRRDQNTSYVITHIEHTAEEGSFIAGSDSGDPTYSNTIKAIPYSVPYRPERATENAQMAGVQVATVVGPQGEEIYTDEFGRIKIKFHWDRSPDEENSTCWCRVSQPWADEHFGAVFIPRIGEEVLVDFMEGDPDRPVIIGRLYNGEKMYPYKLPDKKTHSGIRSRSTKGGGADNFNEIHFDDQKGSELFSTQAEYNKADLVKNDALEEVRHDRMLRVKNDQKEHVDNDKTTHVSGNLTIKVDKDITIGTDSNLKVKVSSDATEQISGNYGQAVSGNVARTVSGNESINVSGNLTLQAGGVMHLKAAQIVLEADDVGISANGSFIDVNSATITIQGPMVLINSGGVPPMVAPAMPPMIPDVEMPAPPEIPDLNTMGDLGGLGGDESAQPTDSGSSGNDESGGSDPFLSDISGAGSQDSDAI